MKTRPTYLLSHIIVLSFLNCLIWNSLLNTRFFGHRFYYEMHVKFTVIPWWTPLKISGTLGNADILRHQNFQQKWLFHTPCHQELTPLYVEIIFTQGILSSKKNYRSNNIRCTTIDQKRPKISERPYGL